MRAFLLILLCWASLVQAQTIGVTLKSSPIDDGLTLFTPLRGTNTYLINNCGEVVNQWSSTYPPGNAVYLLENGNLLRTGNYFLDEFGGRPRGNGGIVELYDWDGKLIWDFEYRSELVLAHHDIVPLPNGNFLLLAWDKHTMEESIQEGRNPDEIPSGVVWSEHIIEVNPNLPEGEEIVWEWYLWDHLVQDFDPTKENFGDVSQSPERVDLNYVDYTNTADWIHANGLDYNEELDQIMISARNFQEVWIIDHSTTTEEATTSQGGKSGKGGDLLYRWGNPWSYKQGTVTEAKLFDQHNTQWIPTDLPDGGKILIFNNGAGRPEGPFSSIEIVDPSEDYTITNGRFTPNEADFTYTDPLKENFFSSFISGVQMMESGNLFICEGANGKMYETTRDGERLWEYINPDAERGILSQGDSHIDDNGVVDTKMFRAERYPLDFPGFEGRSTTGGLPIEQNALPCGTITSVEVPKESIDVFPNPAKDKIRIYNSGRTTKFRITNIWGSVVMESEVVDGEWIDVSSFTPGVYILSVDNTITKLVVQ